MMVHGQTLTAGPNAKSWEFLLLIFKIKFYKFKVVIIIWEAAHYSMLHALEKLLNPDLLLPSNLLFRCFIMESMISMIFSRAYKNTDQDKVSSVLLQIKNNISDKIALLFPDISGMFNHRSSYHPQLLLLDGSLSQEHEMKKAWGHYAVQMGLQHGKKWKQVAKLVCSYKYRITSHAVEIISQAISSFQSARHLR